MYNAIINIGCHNICFFTMFFMNVFLMKYFEVLQNRLKTNKNPDENPDLTMDF